VRGGEERGGAQIGKEFAREKWKRDQYQRPGDLRGDAPTFGGNSWLSHASLLTGRVVRTHDSYEAFLHGKALRISIFMNVFNVHVNRYPVSGTVRFVHYNPGKFLNAATDKSSLENEQMSVGIEDGSLRVLVRQIAGLVARRIVTYSREGDQVEQGERMGIIRFGSRVDVFLPTSATATASVGETTLAGASVIARLAGQ